jgi:hypothetical protein
MVHEVITQEHFGLESEIASLAGGIEEARQRLATAQDAERLEQQKTKARQVLEQLETLDNAAISCDQALKAFLKSFVDLDRVASSVCAATGNPNREIVRVLARRALQTHLLSQFRTFDLGVLAPNERVSFKEMADGWSRIAHGWCAQRLGSPALDVELPIDDAAE